MLCNYDDLDLQAIEWVQNFIPLDVYSIIDFESAFEDVYPTKSGVMAYSKDVLDDTALTTLDEIDETKNSAEWEDISHIDRWCVPNFETLDLPEIMKPSLRRFWILS